MGRPSVDLGDERNVRLRRMGESYRTHVSINLVGRQLSVDNSGKNWFQVYWHWVMESVPLHRTPYEVTCMSSKV